MRELLKLLAHPTRFERVAFAFGGQTPTPPVPEQRIRTNRERGVLQAPRQPRHIPYPAQCTAVDEGQLGGSGAIPFFGRSSNGGFGLREVENALFSN